MKTEKGLIGKTRRRSRQKVSSLAVPEGHVRLTLNYKQLTLLVTMMILCFSAGFHVGELRGSVNLCVDYAFRYLEARGYDLQVSADEANLLINQYRSTFDNWIDGDFEV